MTGHEQCVHGSIAGILPQSTAATHGIIAYTQARIRHWHGTFKSTASTEVLWKLGFLSIDKESPATMCFSESSEVSNLRWED